LETKNPTIRESGIIGQYRTQWRYDRSGQPGASPSSEATNAKKSRENHYRPPCGMASSFVLTASTII
jgi:hypothetical protein